MKVRDVLRLLAADCWYLARREATNSSSTLRSRGWWPSPVVSPTTSPREHCKASSNRRVWT